MLSALLLVCWYALLLQAAPVTSIEKYTSSLQQNNLDVDNIPEATMVLKPIGTRTVSMDIIEGEGFITSDTASLNVDIPEKNKVTKKRVSQRFHPNRPGFILNQPIKHKTS
jgi:hypothetical protein